MELIYSTGGREKYYNTIKVGDCVCRAIANGTGMDYKEVYDLINSYAKREHLSKRKKHKSYARNGVYKDTIYIHLLVVLVILQLYTTMSKCLILLIALLNYPIKLQYPTLKYKKMQQ